MEPLSRARAVLLRRWVPNLWIVGFPKSGTTALWQILHQHPSLQPAYRKTGGLLKEAYVLYPKKHWQVPSVPQEPRSLAGCLGESARLFLRRPWPGYGLLPRFRLESSPDYIYEPDAPRIIRALDPNARIFICLREPVSQILSLYKHWTRIGLHEGRIEFSLDDVARSGIPHRARFEMGRAVTRYLESFDPEAVRFVLFERFARDNAGTARDIVRWLGLRDVAFQLPPSEVSDTVLDLAPDFRQRVHEHFQPQVDALAQMTGLDLKEAWGY